MALPWRCWNASSYPITSPAPSTKDAFESSSLYSKSCGDREPLAAKRRLNRRRLSQEILGIGVGRKDLLGITLGDRKIVLLTFFVRGGKGFKPGETYFVEGNRQSRRMTRLLPIFEVHCTRTAALKYAEVDLRALRDGPPIGYTYRRTSTNEWKEAPSTKVGIPSTPGAASRFSA